MYIKNNEVNPVELLRDFKGHKVRDVLPEILCCRQNKVFEDLN